MNTEKPRAAFGLSWIFHWFFVPHLSVLGSAPVVRLLVHEARRRYIVSSSRSQQQTHGRSSRWCGSRAWTFELQVGRKDVLRKISEEEEEENEKEEKKTRSTKHIVRRNKELSTAGILYMPGFSLCSSFFKINGSILPALFRFVSLECSIGRRFLKRKKRRKKEEGRMRATLSRAKKFSLYSPEGIERELL